MAELTTVTVRTMTTSRLMMRTVSQDGDPRDGARRPGIVGDDERAQKQQLVGHGVEPRPERRLLSRASGDEAVEGIRDAGVTNVASAHPSWPLQHLNYERRDEQHPEQRDLVRDE